jgi:hypothetical protein
MRLPLQCAPVQRDLLRSQAIQMDTGIEAAQTFCDRLPGMARQLCYALTYGVST